MSTRTIVLGLIWLAGCGGGGTSAPMNAGSPAITTVPSAGTASVSAGAGASSASAGAAGTLLRSDAGALSQAGSGARAGSPALDEDAGKPDAGSTMPSVATDFSDDFESESSLDPDRYTTATASCSGTGTVALDSSDAHSGKHSVRVNGSAGYCNHAFFSPKMLPSPLSDPLYARFFVKMQGALGAGHVTFVALHDAHEDHDLRLGGQSMIMMWNRESDDATLPELSPTGIAMSVAPSAGAWHCVEFMIGGKTPSLQTWLDGKAVVGLTVDGQPTQDVDQQWLRDSTWQPQVTDIRFGWESYADQANTLWFDDVAVGKARIGCGTDD